jgi:hypothetical protein
MPFQKKSNIYSVHRTILNYKQIVNPLEEERQPQTPKLALHYKQNLYTEIIKERLSRLEPNLYRAEAEYEIFHI